MSYGICLSLSDILHLAWESRVASSGCFCVSFCLFVKRGYSSNTCFHSHSVGWRKNYAKKKKKKWQREDLVGNMLPSLLISLCSLGSRYTARSVGSWVRETRKVFVMLSIFPLSQKLCSHCSFCLQCLWQIPSCMFSHFLQALNQISSSHKGLRCHPYIKLQ